MTSVLKHYQYKTVEVYNYHPPLPLPRSDLPEQSLGDCAICMDAIMIENRSRGVSEKEKERRGDAEWDLEGANETSTRERGLGSAGLFGAMQTMARKNYSLAPCQHLFVGFNSLFLIPLRATVLMDCVLPTVAY